MTDKEPCHMFEWETLDVEPLGSCITLCGIKAYGSLGIHVTMYERREEYPHWCQACVDNYPLYELSSTDL